MTSHPGRLALLIGAVVLVTVTAGAAVHDPLITAGLVLLLALVYFAARMDGWQRLLALTVVLLVCAASHLAPLADTAFYPRYVAVGCLVAWTACLPGRPGTRLDRWTGAFVVALWATAVVATVSGVWSITPAHTFQQGVALVLLAGLVHALVRRRWTDQAIVIGDLYVVYLVLSLSVVVSIGYGLVDGTVAAAVSSGERFRGVYNNPNLLSAICALTIPLGWAVHRQSRRRVQLLGALAAAFALVLSESRTGLIAVLVGGLWIALRHGMGPLRRLVAVGATVFLLAQAFNLLPAIVGSSWVQQFVGRFTAPETGELSNGRTQLWQAAVELWWQSRPALGFGYGSGLYLFDQARDNDFFAVGVSLVHNSYLQMLLELGLAGAVPLLVLVLAALRVVLRAPMSRVNPGLVWLVLTGLLIQITESAIFGTGQPYPYVFWPTVAAVLLGLPDPHRADRVPAGVPQAARAGGGAVPSHPEQRQPAREAGTAAPR
ncbi:O-antigen ligase family protein [Micromonospora cathayae]|uniref:O-antigen ligase family protein n=1 Tax=Micromonospora cathayae TaxID=3028804 RepID=A0ABY7ZXU8_9ACTN|nr:O-antigen ligase family protein [Micromonospora sp. HUAS 3]WDZ87857.1 O-antigen ligase family protein [Micromonospora sp. HUAS 3]